MLPITRHGLREIVIGSLILAVIAAALGFAHWSLTFLVLPLWIWLFAFFRDPNRTIPAEQHAMVSPADGKVTDIVELDHIPELNGPGVRVGIFLSVFSVHINRAPCEGVVRATKYKPGKFLDVRHPDCSTLNESNTIHMGDVVVKQIAGLIARRIVCEAKPQDKLARGEKFGMIKFGSRTELYIPKAQVQEIRVKLKDKVKGGETVIARTK